MMLKFASSIRTATNRWSVARAARVAQRCLDPWQASVVGILRSLELACAQQFGAKQWLEFETPCGPHSFPYQVRCSRPPWSVPAFCVCLWSAFQHSDESTSLHPDSIYARLQGSRLTRPPWAPPTTSAWKVDVTVERGRL